MWTRCRSFVVAVLVLFSLSTRAGNEVGGGGIAENNILYAFHNLEVFINMCFQTRACALTAQDAALLKEIEKALPQEKKVKDFIQFKADGDFFVVDGHKRIARTGYHVGDPIHFNLGIIYPADVATTPLIPPPGRPLDIPLAVGILIHELGHHHGVKDHTYLDTLGAKVNTALHVYARELDGGPFSRQLIVTSFEFANQRGGELLVRDNLGVYSFGERLLAALPCPAGRPEGFALWNLHWRKSPSEWERVLRARATLNCGGNGAAPTRELETRLFFEKPSGKLLHEKTKFRVIDCGRMPHDCR